MQSDTQRHISSAKESVHPEMTISFIDHHVGDGSNLFPVYSAFPWNIWFRGSWPAPAAGDELNFAEAKIALHERFTVLGAEPVRPQQKQSLDQFMQKSFFLHSAREHIWIYFHRLDSTNKQKHSNFPALSLTMIRVLLCSKCI